MLRLIRIALQVVIFFLLVSVVIGIATRDTGPAEKVALAGLAALLVWAAVPVRRIGRRRPVLDPA